MGGLVNFVTVQPDDLLGKDKRIAGRVAAGYDGSDNGRKLGATVAGRASPEWAWLLSAGPGRPPPLGENGTEKGAGAGRHPPQPPKKPRGTPVGRPGFPPKPEGGGVGKRGGF